ncbi:hypothetical protein KIN20_024329 [Parelaphostrongylus tenuis]|uniref:Uncharacterized protein n=1 Tax=Parelaphostrongylus tenuis TaxID=148309 RepID=A0AAD5QXL1_PARTN|nr:hypothetical protein KIN20_024329 [Parelaphostrongylus tenuis]
MKLLRNTVMCKSPSAATELINFPTNVRSEVCISHVIIALQTHPPIPMLSVQCPYHSDSDSGIAAITKFAHFWVSSDQ